MYERMLDKAVVPSFEGLIDYSGASGALWLALDAYLKDTFSAQRLIRFPYGSKYGWGAKYSYKNKHICDVFTESGAFSLLFHISSSEIQLVYNELTDQGKKVCDDKYSCGTGGWLNYRILPSDCLDDIKKLLQAKMRVPL